MLHNCDCNICVVCHIVVFIVFSPIVPGAAFSMTCLEDSEILMGFSLISCACIVKVSVTVREGEPESEQRISTIIFGFYGKTACKENYYYHENVHDLQ